MKVHLKFLGSLQHSINQQHILFQISCEKSIREIVTELTQKSQFEELKSFFSETLDLKRSLIILLNDQEISTLEGMNTLVKADDRIAFIPVIHGGNLILDKYLKKKSI
ncbi:MAG: MoaD/ThiS family protein [Candidatus Hodarchaeota archaeon]